MTLPSLIEGLLSPGAYPADAFDREGHEGGEGAAARAAEGIATVGVELIQTHISYVFITPRFVFKVKKPVDFGFLDFTTIDKRRHFCTEEVRLNSRLSPGVYLGVVPVTVEDGTPRMGGLPCMEGKGVAPEYVVEYAVDYAVMMRRLPDSGMLDAMIRRGDVTPEVIGRVAETVSAFHGRAEGGPHISEFGSVEVIRKNTEENFSQVEGFVGRTITRARLLEISAYTRGFIEANTSLFEARAGSGGGDGGGFIRDCHGDIHTEHVCIEDERVEIFDCIEFNERFRYSDVVSDAAFLSMDLDFRGRGDLTRSFERRYFERTGDAEGSRLLDFYKCYRAFVRGKVEGFKLDEPEEPEQEKARALLRAMRYFYLSHQYATGGYLPVMVLISGLSGTGKSSVAAGLAGVTGLVSLNSDVIRREIFGPAHLLEEAKEGDPAEYGKGIYSEETTKKTYAELIGRGRVLLEGGRPVILDATFASDGFRDDARQAAKEAGAEFFIVECTAGEDIIKERLYKRAARGGSVSEATWEIYLEQKKRFEPFTGPWLRVDTSLDVGEEGGGAVGVIPKVLRALFYDCKGDSKGSLKGVLL